MFIFKSRHDFNRKIRNGKRHLKIFPAGGDPAILSRKITFHGGIRWDVLFAEKVVLCYRCKTRHMLGENSPVVSPTPEGSDISNIEQSEAPRDSLAPEKPDSSVETQSSAESQQESPPVEEKTDGENPSTEGTGADSDSGSASESSDEDGSELVSSVPETPLQKPVSSTSQKNLPVTQKAQVNPELTFSETNPPSVGNQKCSKTRKPKLNSLKEPNLPPIDRKWYATDVFDMALSKSNIRVNKSTEPAKDLRVNKSTQLAKDLLIMAVELIDNRDNADYLSILNSHTESLRAKHSVNYKPEELDDSA